MTISIYDVEHVANLARLALSEAEKQQFAGQLNNILQHAEELQKLDLDGVEPTSHVLPIHNVMREDDNHKSLSNEQALGNAPDKNNGQFRVPAVMEG